LISQVLQRLPHYRTADLEALAELRLARD
jgi:hypothetical protein